MANRSYLYATNIAPGSEASSQERQIQGISEWNYSIPLVFRLLLSGNTQACRSLIWDESEPIALVGDYALGVERLAVFLQQIEMPEAQPFINEALAFLDAPENKRRFFVLECGEIFEMGEAPIAEQNASLLREIQHLEPEIERALATLRVTAAHPSAFAGISKLFGTKPAQPKPRPATVQAVRELGLGHWSNMLYFDFSDT